MVIVFGLGMFCLLRPRLVLAAFQRRGAHSRQFWRTPAILDAGEAKLWGVMAVLMAVILAGASFIPN